MHRFINALMTELPSIYYYIYFLQLNLDLFPIQFYFLQLVSHLHQISQ